MGLTVITLRIHLIASFHIQRQLFCISSASVFDGSHAYGRLPWVRVSHNIQLSADSPKYSCLIRSGLSRFVSTLWRSAL